jgi:hypothetical protein
LCFFYLKAKEGEIESFPRRVYRECWRASKAYGYALVSIPRLRHLLEADPLPVVLVVHRPIGLTPLSPIHQSQSGSTLG